MAGCFAEGGDGSMVGEKDLPGNFPMKLIFKMHRCIKHSESLKDKNAFVEEVDKVYKMGRKYRGTQGFLKSCVILVY